MATIDGGAGGSRRKALNHEIPLVPFIDLLLCCLMFLLVTAVWNQLTQVPTSPLGSRGDDPSPARAEDQLMLSVSQDGYALRSTIGTEVLIPADSGSHDLLALQTQLQTRHRMLPDERQIQLLPDDDVDMELMVTTIDTLRGEGYVDVRFAGM